MYILEMTKDEADSLKILLIFGLKNTNDQRVKTNLLTIQKKLKEQPPREDRSDRTAALKAAAEKKAEAAKTKVLAARQQLIAEGKKPTLYAVAKRAGVAWKTAKKHLESFPLSHM